MCRWRLWQYLFWSFKLEGIELDILLAKNEIKVVTHVFTVYASDGRLYQFWGRFWGFKFEFTYPPHYAVSTIGFPLTQNFSKGHLSVGIWVSFFQIIFWLTSCIMNDSTGFYQTGKLSHRPACWCLLLRHATNEIYKEIKIIPRF